MVQQYMADNKTEGICSICLKIGELTYEHIPPKSSFNNTHKLYQTFYELFDKHSVMYGKHKNARRGYGKYCLCLNCNNNAGSWYVKCYSKFAKQCMEQLNQMDDILTPNEFTFHKIKPLNILKQVVSMFICINTDPLLDNETNPFELDDELREFVMEKDRQVLPSNYKIYMYTTLSRNARYCSISSVRLANGRNVVISEIAHQPFGFQLSIDSEPTHDMLDITGFLDFKFDEQVTMKLTTSMINIIGPLPGNSLNRM